MKIRSLTDLLTVRDAIKILDKFGLTDKKLKKRIRLEINRRTKSVEHLEEG